MWMGATGSNWNSVQNQYNKNKQASKSKTKTLSDWLIGWTKCPFILVQILLSFSLAHNLSCFPHTYVSHIHASTARLSRSITLSTNIQRNGSECMFKLFSQVDPVMGAACYDSRKAGIWAALSLWDLESVQSTGTLSLLDKEQRYHNRKSCRCFYPALIYTFMWCYFCISPRSFYSTLSIGGMVHYSIARSQYMVILI